MHCYPIAVIVPVSDEMTTVFHGSSDPSQAAPPAWALRGVGKRLSTPVMPSLNYAAYQDAELIARELSGKTNIRISLLNEAAMTAGFSRHLRQSLTGAQFLDITDEIDEIKAIKSPEEAERIKENALLHDQAMRACFDAIRPGARDFEVAAAGRARCLMLGSEQQIIFVGSAPQGQPVPFNLPHAMNRTIQEGDQVGILIEANDASGYYTHLYRIACLGEVREELLAQYELAREAQNLTLGLVKPGADPVELLRRNNEFMRDHGLPEETRIYAHGQGYDMVERPSFQPGETMKIKADMNVSVHPAAAGDRAFAMITDNYMVGETGVGPCLHETPKKVFSL
jgi:Xaa-Pro aminopeptidase